MTQNNNDSDETQRQSLPSFRVRLLIVNLSAKRQILVENLGVDNPQAKVLEISNRDISFEVPKTFCDFGENLAVQIDYQEGQDSFTLKLNGKITKKSQEDVTAASSSVTAQFDEVHRKDLEKLALAFQKRQAITEKLFLAMRGE